MAHLVKTLHFTFSPANLESLIISSRAHKHKTVVISNKTSQLKWIINWKCIEITGFVICCRSNCFGVVQVLSLCDALKYFTSLMLQVHTTLLCVMWTKTLYTFADNSFIFVLKFKTRRNSHCCLCKDWTWPAAGHAGQERNFHLLNKRRQGQRQW